MVIAMQKEIMVALVSSTEDDKMQTLNAVLDVYRLVEPPQEARAAEQRLVMAVESALNKSDLAHLEAWGGYYQLYPISAQPRPVEDLTDEQLQLIINHAAVRLSGPAGEPALRYASHTLEHGPRVSRLGLVFDRSNVTVH